MSNPDRPPTAGVRRAGLAFALGTLFFAYAFALRVSPSVMVEDLMRDFAVGAAILGNLSAFYFYAYSGLQIPVGVLLDRFGPRRLMTASAIAVTIGTLLFAWAQTIELAYGGRLLIGAGCAFSWAGTLAIVNQWFPHRFALLAGVSQMVAMGGAMLGQGPLATVVDDIGWRDSMAILAAIGALLAVAIWLVTRDRMATDASGARVTGSPRAVVTNPQTWLAAGFGLSMASPMLAFGALWGVPFLGTAYGIDRPTAAGVASLVFAGNGVGSVLVGWWSDRLGRRRLPMFVAAGVAVSTQLTYTLVPGLPLEVVGALIFICGIGCSGLVLSLAVGREHNSLANAGLTIGIVNCAVTGSGALLQPLVGVLLDLGWSGAMADGARIYSVDDYRHALLVVPAVGIAGMVCVAFIRETYCQQQERR